MREAVRPLLPADAAEVAALEAQAREELTAFRGADVLLAERAAVADWAALAARPGSAVWVATLDDAVVGYLHLAIDATVATVRQVYVHPEARELGCGDGLLEAAMAFAGEHACTALEAVALPGDRATKNLYERAGVTARLLVMRRLLD
jgi:GNAT superfamily N-acetyltransferase